MPLEGGHSQWLEPSYPPNGVTKDTWVGVRSVTFTPDTRFAYFSETRFDSAHWTAQTSIYKFDLESHQRVRMTEESSGRQEFKPQVSRSGIFLAYARRNGPGDTELRIRNLQTDEDRRLTSISDHDPWRFGDRGDEIPAYAFTPDDRFIVIGFGGKLHKISVATGVDALIPFRVCVRREVAEPIRAHYRIPDGPVQVRAIRWPSVAADNSKIVFSAAGHLFFQTLPYGEPRRLTDSEDFEYMPALSPDGETVAYVSFPHTNNGVGPGALVTLKLDGRTSRTVLADAATYFLPSWSPDGTRLAVIRESKSADKSSAEFGWVELATGNFHGVASSPGIGSPGNEESYSQLISFSADGKRLLFSKGDQGSQGDDSDQVLLYSVNMDGSNRREIAHATKDIRGILPSPDESRAILIGGDEAAYVADLPVHISDSIELKIPFGTVHRVSDSCAYFPRWRGVTNVTYSCSNKIFRYDVGPKKATAAPIEVNLRIQRREGAGILAFRNARIVTVAGNNGAGPVIDHGTIVVRGRRIDGIGTGEDVSIPSEAKVIDATGWTIMPGLIDVHYHSLGDHAAKMTPAPGGHFGDPSALAYGVTTGWDALGGENDGPLSLAEMRDVGLILGPRWFFAIEPVNMFDRDFPPLIRSFEDAKAIVQKRAANGVLQVLKEYDEPNRTTAGWFAEAARQQGLAIASHTEGLPHLLKRAADGYDVEHPFISVPLYEDVLKFLARTGTIWTPNIIIALGTAPPRYAVENQVFPNLVRQRGHDDSAKLDRYAGRFLQNAEHGEIMALDKAIPPYEQTTTARVGQAVASALAAGVKVAISGHNSPGILTHFEMWALQRGGASNGDVIRAATMTGAEKLGIQGDVGSLEPGKIADFLVLTSNPLDNIENTLDLKYTVADGIVYDSDTLEQIWPKKAP